MKVYAVSDLHLSITNPKPMDIFGVVWANYLEDVQSSLSKAKDEDLILIAGDISWAMTLENAVSDLKYISDLCKGKKIIIRGNHDYWWKSISAVRKILPDNVYALQNDALKFDNLIVAGSRGWSHVDDNAQTHDQKIYDRELLRMELSLSAAKKLQTNDEKLIVMTHFPPFNVKGESSPMTRLIGLYKPDAVIYGHLHGRDCRVQSLIMVDTVPYYLSSCDLIKNQAIEIPLD